jgi:hypothetical protein
MNPTRRRFVAGDPSPGSKTLLRACLVALAGVAISACDRAPPLAASERTDSQSKPVASPGASVRSPAELEATQRALEAQGNSRAPQESGQADPQARQDPFKAALDESNRQRAAAAAFPFGTSSDRTNSRTP